MGKGSGRSLQISIRLIELLRWRKKRKTYEEERKPMTKKEKEENEEKS